MRGVGGASAASRSGNRRPAPRPGEASWHVTCDMPRPPPPPGSRAAVESLPGLSVLVLARVVGCVCIKRVPRLHAAARVPMTSDGRPTIHDWRLAC